ncbi:MAG TPA: hypothetical protein PLW66_07745, partial [Saprospiraceae bacterium]|nr:hypothetical protein [Saprospiraceae bacterium]
VQRQAPALALLKYLMETEGQADKTQVQQLLFPGKAPGRLEKVMVEAGKLLRRFLLQQYYQEQESSVGQQLDWQKILQSRGLDGWQRQALFKLVRRQRALPGGNPRDSRDRFDTEYALFLHETDHNYLRTDLNVPTALSALDGYYYLMRLNLLNQYLLQQKVRRLDLSGLSGETAELSIEVPEHLLQESPLLLISFKINRLLSQEPPPLDDFRVLAELLRQHGPALDPAVLKDFYSYLRSTCALLINAGEDNLLPFYHQLQVESLERGYLYYDGNRIPHSAYLAVTTAALRCGNFDWALEFIEAHKGRVLGENASFDLYRLNLACYYFTMGSYQQALDLLAPTYEYLDYTLPGKRLELKILYELGSELLSYKAGAFKIFIARASRKFMPAALRKANGDFVNLLLQIIRSRPRDKARGERLCRRILARPQAAERDWLLEKAARLR